MRVKYTNYVYQFRSETNFKFFKSSIEKNKGGMRVK
jgi:hypothetical protein